MPRKTTSWTLAIIEVLRDAGEPLPYSEIAQRVVDAGLRKPTATPENTIAATFSLSLKNEGDASPFVRVERGIYGLRGTGADATTSSATRSQGSADPAVGAATEASLAESDEQAEEMGLINAFGMFWRRDLVSWDKAGGEQLLGRQQGGVPVNFAEQSGVYVLYDSGRIIYVGQVQGDRMWGRLYDHTRDRLEGRWDRFSWFGVRGVADNGSLKEAPATFSLRTLITTLEALLIEGLEPPQNRRQGDGFKAVEFIQARDPQLAAPKKAALEAILNDL